MFTGHGAGKNNKTLQELRYGEDLEFNRPKFAQMIQSTSGKHVTLVDHTQLVFYCVVQQYAHAQHDSTSLT